MNVAIVGIGIHPFGRHPELTAAEMGLHAVRSALADADISWRDIQFAAGGSVDHRLTGKSGASADSLVANLGLTGLPFLNVENGCATAGSAVATVAAAIEAGICDIGLAVGFDKHAQGHFKADPEQSGLGAWYRDAGLMVTTQFFGMKIIRYMHEHDISRGTLAKVAARAYRNAEHNPNAWRRRPLSEAEILESRMLNYPLSQYMFCSPGEGAAAVVLSRADRLPAGRDRAVLLSGISVRTRRYGSFEVFAPYVPLDGAPSPTVDASQAAFNQAGVGPGDLDLAQIQDTDAGTEVIHLAENGLCRDGEQEELIRSGATEITGRIPINTDGGLIANGEPIGASGMRQVYETVLQLRGEAGVRQIPGRPQAGYCQVYGAPGLAAAMVLTR